MRAQLSAAETETDRLRAELATARRDAFAAGIEQVVTWSHRLSSQDRETLHEWAAEIRAGSRPVPGSPQPDRRG